MRFWFQRLRFRRALRRYKREGSLHQLLLLTERIPQKVYERYRCVDGLKQRLATRYLTIAHFDQALEQAIAIVEQHVYVQRQKPQSSYYLILLDDYLSTVNEHALSLKHIDSQTNPRVQTLLKLIIQHEDEQSRYYERQYQHLIDEYLILINAIEVLISPNA